MLPTGLKKRPGLKIVLAVLGVLCFLVPDSALATTQFSEILYLNGQKHSLDTLPLEPYYGPGNPRPKFRAPNTATWRGYIATWEIDRGVLYLKAIRAWTDQGEVGLPALFPARKARCLQPGLAASSRSPRARSSNPRYLTQFMENTSSSRWRKAEWSTRRSLTILGELDHRNGNHPEAVSLREASQRTRGV